MPRQDGIKKEKKVTENLSLIPITTYNKTKLIFEKLLMSTSSKDFKTYCLRPGTICGHSPRTRFDLSVNILTLSALKNKVIKVFGENFDITIGKKNILSNKKRLFSKLQDKKSVTKVFEELSKRYNTRKGGYSRVLRAGYRTGDDAPMAVIELVDRNPEAKKIDKPKKTETKDKLKETESEQKLAKK